MPRRTLGNLIVLGLALAIWFPAAAQAQEVVLLFPEYGQLIHTEDGSSGGSLTLDWQDYPGALSYRVSYAREDQPTPVVRLITGTSQCTMLYTISGINDFFWSVKAYSDANGQNQIASSAEWFFTVTKEPAPTATPTITLDYNTDGMEDGIDIFYFAILWYQDKLTIANQPGSVYFDKANIATGALIEIIDQRDLIALKKAFSERTGPVPTPALPAPLLVQPYDFFEYPKSNYATSSGLYAWMPLSGAAKYQIELTGPGQHGTRNFITPDTEYYTANARNIVFPDDPDKGRDQITQLGTLRWRVRGITASGEEGDWSETRSIYMMPDFVSGPVDIYPDGKADGLDIFLFSYSWQTVRNVDSAYRQNADLVDIGKIDALDMLEFISGYQEFRNTGTACQLPAPVVSSPADGTVFTLDEVRKGQASINWSSVSGSAGYRIVFRSGNQISVRQPLQIPYPLVDTDTTITNGLPITFTVEALCPGEGGGWGTPSDPRTFTIDTTTP
jgi:hypothetical protein